MQRFSFALLLAALVTSQQVSAASSATSEKQSNQPLTLAEAIRLAKANNPALAANRLSREVAEGAADQARRWPNPELEFSSEDIPAGSGGLSSAQNMIGVSQTIPYAGKKKLDAEIGRQSVTLADSEYQIRERDLVRDVKSAFFETLAAEKRVAASEELLALAQSLGDAARKRVAAGAAGRQETVRAEIETERVSVAISAARRDLEESRKNLATLTGNPAAMPGPLQGSLRESVLPPATAKLREQWLAQHPALRAAQAGRERAQLELRRAEREPLPDVTLGLGAGRNGASDETIMEFRASLPLPLLDRAQGRKRETRALAEAAKFDESASAQRLLQEFGIAEVRLKAAREQAEAYRTRILPKAEEALILVRGGFEAGKFGFLDLVDTQRTAAESRLEYLDKLLELNLAATELEALAGVEISE